MATRTANETKHVSSHNCIHCGKDATDFDVEFLPVCDAHLNEKVDETEYDTFGRNTNGPVRITRA